MSLLDQRTIDAPAAAFDTVVCTWTLCSIADVAQAMSEVSRVLRPGGRLVLAGCGLGVVGSVAASRLVNSFLFGVSATDPLIYIAAVVIMLMMTLLAAAIPATRAASANPAVALRSI